MAQGTPSRKSRVQGKIDKMPEAQQQQVRAWLREADLTLSDIAKRIRESFGVSISPGSLSTYYSKHSRELLQSQSFEQRPLHVRLVLHVQIRPELVASSEGSQ